MALEIKVLDYGDVELESSFLVLGRDPGFNQSYLSRATSISTLPVEAGSKRPSRPRWQSDPQAAPCRITALKCMPRLPRRSAARCNLIKAVSRLRFPEQSGSSPRTTCSAWRRSVFEPGWQRHRAFASGHRSKNSSSFLGKNPEWAGRDRSPQSRRRCGMVEVHLNRYGARCQPEGTRCFPSWHRCASSGGARGTD